MELAQSSSSPDKRALYLRIASVWHQMSQRWEKKLELGSISAGQVAHERRGAADRDEYRQAAGAVASLKQQAHRVLRPVGANGWLGTTFAL